MSRLARILSLSALVLLSAPPLAAAAPTLSLGPEATQSELAAPSFSGTTDAPADTLVELVANPVDGGEPVVYTTTAQGDGSFRVDADFPLVAGDYVVFAREAAGTPQQAESQRSRLSVGSVQPLARCAVPDGDGYLVRLGYRSSYSVGIMLPAGETGNRLDPRQDLPGQVSAFAPGEHEMMDLEVGPSTGAVTWALDGHTLVIDGPAELPRCDEDSAPQESASPTPEVTPTPEPVATPTPTPEPVVTPTPTPEPVVTPTPTPQASPTPVPATLPTPGPATPSQTTTPPATQVAPVPAPQQARPQTTSPAPQAPTAAPAHSLAGRSPAPTQAATAAPGPAGALKLAVRARGFRGRSQRLSIRWSRAAARDCRALITVSAGKRLLARRNVTRGCAIAVRVNVPAGRRALKVTATPLGGATRPASTTLHISRG